VGIRVLADSGHSVLLVVCRAGTGIPVVLILRAARRFRAESPKRRAILALAVALLALWAGASTVNFFALWADPEQHGRMMLYLTLTYAAFGSGLVMVMRERAGGLGRWSSAAPLLTWRYCSLACGLTSA